MLEPTGPRQDSAPGAARHRARCHHSQSHISGEHRWARAGPWGAGTSPTVDGPGAEAEELLDTAPGEAVGAALPINPTVPKYNQTSPVPVPIPSPTADSQGSFQPHNHLHFSTRSCPMGLASSCPPLAQAGEEKAAVCSMMGEKPCQGTPGAEAPPSRVAPGSA